MSDTLLRLETLIADRASADASSSYTARLLEGGVPLVARKFGEEAIELVVAAMSNDRAAVVAEAADLLFHYAVLLRATGVEVADVAAELARRESQSGLAEKAARVPAGES